MFYTVILLSQGIYENNMPFSGQIPGSSKSGSPIMPKIAGKKINNPIATNVSI